MADDEDKKKKKKKDEVSEGMVKITQSWSEPREKKSHGPSMDFKTVVTLSVAGVSALAVLLVFLSFSNLGTSGSRSASGYAIPYDCRRMSAVITIDGRYQPLPSLCHIVVDTVSENGVELADQTLSRTASVYPGRITRVDFVPKYIRAKGTSAKVSINLTPR